MIVKLADHAVADPAELRILTAGLDVGAQVPLVFVREGKEQSVTVKISELPDSPEAAFLGFHVREIAGAEGRTGIEVDKVVPESPAAQAGLRAGTRILGVGRIPVSVMPEFETAVRRFDPQRGLPLLVIPPEGGRPLPLLIGGKNAAGHEDDAENVGPGGGR